MKKELLKLIVCPDCKRKLTVEIHQEDEEIKEGYLNCNCGKRYQIKKYVPCFVETDQYVHNFSFEWKAHAKTQLDSYKGIKYSEKKFFDKTGFDKRDFKNKLFLDVGCGTGRYSEIVLKYGGIVVGVDLSYSIFSAHKNMGCERNIHFVQADIYHLPFNEQIFDYVFSIGVLQHTPNPPLAFREITKPLKKNGYISIWVYGWNSATTNSILWRKITTKLPASILYYGIYLFIPVYFINKALHLFPATSRLLHLILPGFIYHGFPFVNDQPYYDWFVLCTFDYYSPQYQFYYEPKEVFDWFKNAELKDIELLFPKIAIKARK